MEAMQPVTGADQTKTAHLSRNNVIAPTTLEVPGARTCRDCPSAYRTRKAISYWHCTEDRSY